MQRYPSTVASAQRVSALSTNKVLRNTYLLLGATLAFSALTAGVSMVFNLPHPGLLITLIGYFGLLFGVYKTRDSALAYGLTDRGLIAPGMKADINVIDFDALSLLKPELVYDLPAGGKRLIQRARGYRHTFVSGVETLCNDELTGALPGRVLR